MGQGDTLMTMGDMVVLLLAGSSCRPMSRGIIGTMTTLRRDQRLGWSTCAGTDVELEQDVDEWEDGDVGGLMLGEDGDVGTGGSRPAWRGLRLSPSALKKLMLQHPHQS